MFTDLSHVLVILEHYKYLVIFPIMIVEGPIITIISGFLVYLGFLNVFVLYPLLVIGDLIGDSAYYAIGRYGSQFMWLKKIASKLGYDRESRKFIKNHFEKHPTKTLILAKVSHGLGMPVQVTAGVARLNFFKYFSIELLGTMPKTLVLLVIGFYIGDSYVKIGNYLHLIAFTAIAIVVATLLYLIVNKYIKKSLGED